jgi:ribosomal protein L44E
LDFDYVGNEEKFKFIDNKSIKKQIVGVTCETCAENCKKESPFIRLKRNENTDLIVQKYMAKFSWI